jgi:hypothetical protein
MKAVCRMAVFLCNLNRDIVALKSQDMYIDNSKCILTIFLYIMGHLWNITEINWNLNELCEMFQMFIVVHH